ncbi:hypothetical protein L210DRAFT_3574162 [Boletus edulis BED1]|uniref:Secreted protein n=1 Tax=Boletus edulis BED1 TaxID=1328754 RepID=A0AAD4BCS3_BOLED|nr:hypothetical protein L210DRAFT_3574162 [Boletus edulis BED1]
MWCLPWFFIGRTECLMLDTLCLLLAFTQVRTDQVVVIAQFATYRANPIFHQRKKKTGVPGNSLPRASLDSSVTTETNSHV